MKATTWLELSFPREVTAEQGLAALLALSGLSTPRRREVLVLQAKAQAGQIVHHLGLPSDRASGAIRQLQTAIPGLAAKPVEDGPVPAIDRAWQVWQSTGIRGLVTDQAELMDRSLLTALANAKDKEQLVYQWLLGPVRRPQWVGSEVTGTLGPGWLGALAKAPFIAPRDLDAEARRALRTKQGLPGWRAVLRIGVQAEGVARQRQLLGQLAAAVRLAQGAGVQLGFDGLCPKTLEHLRRPARWGVVINVGELLGLTAWPLGDTAHLPVARVRAHVLPASRNLARGGHVIGEASYPGQERPVTIPVADALMHTHLVGATGSGKSTVLLNLITQDLAAGRAVAVIEPKGDLIADVLARVPKERVGDVVLLDPTDSRPVGLNPLHQPGVPGEVIVDQVLAVFRGLFGDAIGPRTADLLSAGLLTLTSQPDMSLMALPLLFTDPGFRRPLVAKLDDHLVLGPFWAWYEGLSSAEQAAVLAPLMNKLRSFLLRPRLRRVIGQLEPKFDVRDFYRQRKIVLINLNKGAMGPQAAGLLGALAVSMLWQATLGRSRIPAERRHPSFIYVDEFQDYLHLPQDFADVLTQARGLGTGLVLAHQHLGQLNPNIRAAVLANARSRLVFTTSLEDAAALVRGDRRLSPEDVAGLGRFEAYASLLRDNEPQPFTSVRTLPPPMAVSSSESVAACSRMRYGVDAEEVDAALEALVSSNSRNVHGQSEEAAASFGVRRRKPTGGGQV